MGAEVEDEEEKAESNSAEPEVSQRSRIEGRGRYVLARAC